MKSVINLFKLAIKYGALVMAIIKVIEFAIDEFEKLDLSKDKKKVNV
ncbi:hypothetical protein [Pontimicrobium aquaticum]|nr:hypothetical protein [Pontimicrobium aquaticum]